MGRVGFIGLGVMGAPMAGHLAKAGIPLTVWNRTASKAEPFAAQGVAVASSLTEIARVCDVLILCVNRTEDVKECLVPVVENAQPDTLVIDHSTISPPRAGEFHGWLAEHDLRFVDAPITGGSMGAVNGSLTIFCGGAEADVTKAIEVVQPYSRRAERVGGPGSGQAMKMANQIAVGGALLALCESLAFAEKAGLDLAQTRSLLSTGAAGSWAFENYGPKILAKDWSPGFSIRNQRKDFAYCRETAASLDASIPGTELVDRLLSELESAGEGEKTTAMLFEQMLKSGYQP